MHACCLETACLHRNGWREEYSLWTMLRWLDSVCENVEIYDLDPYFWKIVICLKKSTFLVTSAFDQISIAWIRIRQGNMIIFRKVEKLCAVHMWTNKNFVSIAMATIRFIFALFCYNFRMIQQYFLLWWIFLKFRLTILDRWINNISKFEGRLSTDVLKFINDDFVIFTVCHAEQVFKVKNFTEGNARKTDLKSSWGCWREK